MEFKIGALYKFYDVFFIVTGKGKTDFEYTCTPSKFSKNPSEYVSYSFHINSSVGLSSKLITDNKKVIDKFMKLL